MSKSVNKVTILGHVGKEVDSRSNGAVASLVVATNEPYKDEQGNWGERAEWHNIVLFKRLAEIAIQYVKKGDKIYVEGRLQTRSWDKDGQKHYKTEIVATDLVLLGGGSRESTSQRETLPTRTPEPAAVMTDDGLDLPF